MEKIVKLKTRPLSTQTTTEFGGLCHLPRARLGLWYDERNLSADQYPTLSVRKQRATVESVDGNELNVDAAAICSGDHMIIMDTMGKLWCNGHCFEFFNFWSNTWRYTLESNTAQGHMEPASGETPALSTSGTPADLLGSWVENPTVAYLRYEGEEPQWNAYLADGTMEIEDVDLSEYGMSWEGTSPGEITGGEGFVPTVTITGELFQKDIENGVDMVVMGGKLIIRYNTQTGQKKMWVSITALANDEEMVYGTNYGDLERVNRVDDPDATWTDVPGQMNDKYVRLQMYSLSDGPVKKTAVKYGTTAPTGATGTYWFDSSGGETRLKVWSAAQQTWVLVESPYTQVYCPSSGIMSGIKEGDVVKLEFVPQSTPENGLSQTEVDSAVALLNGYHKIVKRSTSNTFVIEGLILPDENSEGYAGAKGFYVRLAPAPGQTTVPHLTVERKVPDMDYLIACGNRLWGCRYDEDEGINEIYGSKLGDPTNWYDYSGLSTDSWTASRGTAAPFTGAIAYHDNPLFFREESLEKVYISSTGAHQIQTFDLDGVLEGSADSLCVIEDRLYYLSRNGVMVYTGSTPGRISEAFGCRRYKDGIAAAHRRKYCISMVDVETNERLVGVYDLRTGDWHLETEPWTSRAATWKGELYYVHEGALKVLDGAAQGMVPWSAVSCPQLVELPEHKWISYLRIRIRFVPSDSDDPTVVHVYVYYDEDGWEPLRSITKYWTEEFTQMTKEIVLFPRRKEHFRLKLVGTGPVEIDSISYRVERSEGGH